LWPSYDELRADFPACESKVATFVRKLSGSVDGAPLVEECARPDMIKLGMVETAADALLARASNPKALAIVRIKALAFECIFARPSPEEFDALRDKIEIARRDGGFQMVCEMCVPRVLWCASEIGELLKRWPGLAEDLFTVSMLLGGLAAEMSSKRL
jgi:hypothetical protein